MERDAPLDMASKQTGKELPRQRAYAHDQLPAPYLGGI